MGFIPLTEFEKKPFILFVITLGIFMGKVFGGILCDRWGIKNVVLISTVFVMGLFMFSFYNPYLWTMVQIIVNLSMPITLYLMYKSMPRNPAFSFGLAASCLVFGLVFSFLFSGVNISKACFLILFMLNSGIIVFCERKIK